jgi:hypothetical protein
VAENGAHKDAPIFTLHETWKIFIPCIPSTFSKKRCSYRIFPAHYPASIQDKIGAGKNQFNMGQSR